ncbi:hypothetical protein BD779DRAFT_1477705 [Infundibulicybe gibba]|nr:hypothetical protein BD779DRAFT_1477705 [Infundibulicybe gibba]
MLDSALTEPVPHGFADLLPVACVRRLQWVLLGNANITQSDECRTGDLIKHSDTRYIHTPETPPALLKIFANAYVEHHLHDIIDLAMATLKFFDVPCATWAEHASTAGIAYVALQERRPDVQCIPDWKRMEYLSSSACKLSDVRLAGDDTEFLNALTQLAPALGIVIAVHVEGENVYLIHAQDVVVGIGCEQVLEGIYLGWKLALGIRGSHRSIRSVGQVQEHTLQAPPLCEGGLVELHFGPTDIIEIKKSAWKQPPQ